MCRRGGVTHRGVTPRFYGEVIGFQGGHTMNAHIIDTRIITANTGRPHSLVGSPSHRSVGANRRPAHAVARQPESVYRRRRLVVGTLAAFLVVTGGLVVNEFVVGDSDGTASAAVAGPPTARVTVTAQPGDTLWSIAQEHRGSVNANDYVDRLISLNGGPSIQAGQAIVLP